jgi:hypothetical protein
MTTIYAPTPENPLTTTQKIRNQRLFMLQDCDWTVGIDSPFNDAKKTEWVTYRQALRDLPSLYTDDDNFIDVTFPTEPE